MRVTEHSMYLQVLQLFNESAIAVATPRRAVLLSGLHTLHCLCTEVGRPPRRGRVSNPPPQTETVSRQPGLGCYPHVCDSFSQEDCNVWGFFFSFFLNAHLVWAVMQEIWGANIWCEEGLKSPAGGGGGSFWQLLSSVRGLNEEC